VIVIVIFVMDVVEVIAEGRLTLIPTAEAIVVMMSEIEIEDGIPTEGQDVVEIGDKKEKKM